MVGLPDALLTFANIGAGSFSTSRSVYTCKRAGYRDGDFSTVVSSKE
jgi:hypothetical protein